MIIVLVMIGLIYFDCQRNKQIEWENTKTKQKIAEKQQKIDVLQKKYKELAKLNTELMNDKNQIAKENKILADKLIKEVSKPSKIKYITVDKKKYVLKSEYDRVFNLAIEIQDQFDKYKAKDKLQAEIFQRQIATLKEKEQLYKNQIRILNNMNYKLYQATKRKVFIGVGITYGMRTNGELGGVVGLTLSYRII